MNCLVPLAFLCGKSGVLKCPFGFRLFFVLLVGGLAHGALPGQAADWNVVAGETNLSLAIPDGDASGIARTITVSEPERGLIRDLQVRLQLAGGYSGDLYVALTHRDPGGRSGFTVLLNRIGLSTNNPLGSAGRGLDITLGLTGTGPDIHRAATNAPGTVLTGVFEPDGRTNDPLAVVETDARTALLEACLDTDVNGAWSLLLADVSGGLTATLTDWSLEFQAEPRGPFVSPPHVVVAADLGQCSASVVPLGTPEIRIPYTSVTSNPPGPYPVGITPVVWTLADTNGGMFTSTQRVTVVDTQPPILVAPADLLTNLAAGQCALTNPFLGLPLVNDNCAVVLVTNDAPSVFRFGTTVVTWKAADAGGNQATAVQQVIVTDTHYGCPDAYATLPRITEFMADNTHTLADEEGAYSDWIEIYNPGANAVDLLNWSLTDTRNNLTKWQFPATNLAAGQYLVVYASNKNRRTAGQPLHTNFKLDAQGEYLGLVRSDGRSIVSEFAPVFPPQAPDIAFGYGAALLTNQLVTTNATGRITVPQHADRGYAWTLAEFNDSTWLPATNGVGYETGQSEFSGAASALMAQNPAGYWALGESGGGTAQNQGALGAVANGTLLGAVTFSQAGPRPPEFPGFDSDNMAMHFDGATAKIDVPYHSALNPPTFTISCWARVTGGAGTYRSPLTSRDDYPQRGYIFYAAANNTWQFWSGSGVQTGWDGDGAGGPAVVNNQWVHLAGTYDGVTKRFYVNAQLARSVNVTIAPNTSKPLRIGAGATEATAGAVFFPGEVDEVAVFGRALSGAEVLQLYQAATNASAGGSVTNWYYAGLIRTDIRASLYGQNSSAYLRFPFVLTEPAQAVLLKLRLKYDDGFVAYLNGQPVAGANAPDPPAWNSAATNRHATSDARAFEEFDLTDMRGFLRSGTNVLAIHGLNLDATNSDFLVLPELEIARQGAFALAARYFSQPTPSRPNGVGTADLGPLLFASGATPGRPLQPATNDSITVTVRVAQVFAPVASVVLNWRIMFGVMNQSPMLDDGAHGDGPAGDGVYGAIIPAGVAGPGEIVRWYVTAADTSNRTSRLPAFEDPLNSPEYEGTMTADPRVASALPVWHWFAANYTAAHQRNGVRGVVFYNGGCYDNVFIRQRGGYTVQLASQKFDFNTGYHCRINDDLGSVEEANLNGNGADPSYLRQPLAFEVYRTASHPASACFPVLMRYNAGSDRVGLFIEQVDERFLRRRGLDEQGALYKFVQRAQLTPAFNDVTDGVEKKTRLDENSSDLQALATALLMTNNPEARAAFLFDHFDLANLANFFAARTLMRNEDCVRKNFYLHCDNHGTREWRLFPWDMDLSLNTGGNPNQAAHPFHGDVAHRWTNPDQWNWMWEALFNDPRTRPMILRRMRTVMDQILQPPGTANPWLEARADYWFAPALPFLGLSVSNYVTTLKSCFGSRRTELYVNYAATNVAAGDNALIPPPQPAEVTLRFGAVEYNPASGNQAQEYVCLTNPNPFAVDLSGWQIAGAIRHAFPPGTVIRSNDVMYVSPDVVAFRARTTGPSGGQKLYVQGNYQGQLSAWGETLTLADPTGRMVATNTYPGSPSLAQQYLRLTEIMYHPAPGGAYAQEEYEYLELKNISATVTLDLNGIKCTNGITFAFITPTPLAPDQRLVLVKNPAAFTSRYGSTLPMGGIYTGSLDNAGERLTLLDASNEQILDFSYAPSWYPLTDGLGFSLVIGDENAPWNTWGLAASWQASGSCNGSPGSSELVPPPLPPIKVNEVLSASAPPLTDAIELYNPTAANVNVGGWFITDDFYFPAKYRIPEGTTIPANGYLVFTEAQFNPGGQGFAFNSDGEEAWVFSGDANSNLTGYYHGFTLGAAETNVSLGRYVASTGEEQCVPQSVSTLGTNNWGPRVGPVVISQIMYGPSNGVEYLQLENLTGTAVSLFDPATQANPWKVVGLNYEFPPNTWIPAHGALILTTTNTTAFRAAYPVPTNASVLSVLGGVLSDRGENLELQKPCWHGTNLLYVTVDLVQYGSSAPWPADALGTGRALLRQPISAFGNDPSSWVAGVPVPGTPTAIPTVPGLVSPPRLLPSHYLQAGFLGWPNLTYRVDRASNLTGPWELGWTNLPARMNGLFELEVPVDSATPQLYFRSLNR